MAKPRGRAFEAGNNQGRGRPKGSRNRKTVLFQELLDSYGEVLIKKCMMDAARGDRHSMRLCMERLLAPRRESTVKLSLPKVNTLVSVDLAGERLITAITRGEVAPAEGQAIAAILEHRRRAIESSEMEKRIVALESKQESDI